MVGTENELQREGEPDRGAVKQGVGRNGRGTLTAEGRLKTTLSARDGGEIITLRMFENDIGNVTF